MSGRSWAIEMGCAMEGKYSGDPRVNRFQLTLTLAASAIIIWYNKLHSLSFLYVDLTCSVHDFVDPHGRVG
jgi:hypothetical protein